MMFAVALTALALNAPAPVPVSGGTGAERAVVRQVLASADRGVVRFARIDGKHRLVLGPPAARAPGVAHERARWEAEALAADVQARLTANSDALAGFDLVDNTSGSFDSEGGPSMSPPGARKLLAIALSHARAAGLTVRVARVVPVGGGLVDVVIRLRDDQLFDAAAQAALMTLFGPGTATPGPLHFLSVETPDGTALAYGGSYVNGGSWSYGGDTGNAPVPRTVPRRLWQAPTDVTVHLTRAIGLVRDRTYRIVCDGSRPAPGSWCRRVLADRWALLVPAPGWACLGDPIGAWNVSVRGTFAGHPVSRSYDGCYGGTVSRWARLLGA